MSEFPPRKVERIAILGLGSIGSRHAENAQALGLSVVGFDPGDGAREQATGLGVALADTAQDALANADIALVASPSGQHQADLASCLSADLPVLVEKPIGHDPDAVASLLDQADEHRLQVGGVFNLRQREIVAALPAEIAALGPPRWARFVSASWLPEWRENSDYRTGYANDAVGGGAVFDVIHEIDLANHLLGPAKTASAVLRRTGALELQTEDMAEIVLQHAGGCMSSLHLDFGSRVRRRYLEVSGETGAIAADLRHGCLQRFDAAGSPQSEARYTFEPNTEYQLVLAQFVDAVRSGDSPPCGGREALDALRQAAEAHALSGFRVNG